MEGGGGGGILTAAAKKRGHVTVGFYACKQQRTWTLRPPAILRIHVLYHTIPANYDGLYSTGILVARAANAPHPACHTMCRPFVQSASTGPAGKKSIDQIKYNNTLKCFQRLDLDNDGFITIAELLAVAESSGNEILTRVELRGIANEVTACCMLQQHVPEAYHKWDGMCRLCFYSALTAVATALNLCHVVWSKLANLLFLWLLPVRLWFRFYDYHV